MTFAVTFRVVAMVMGVVPQLRDQPVTRQSVSEP